MSLHSDLHDLMKGYGFVMIDRVRTGRQEVETFVNLKDMITVEIRGAQSTGAEINAAETKLFRTRRRK